MDLGPPPDDLRQETKLIFLLLFSISGLHERYISYSFLDLESIHCLKEAPISRQQGLCCVQSANCPCVQAIQCLPCCKDAQGLLCPHSSSLFHNSRIKKIDINRQFQTSHTDALIINRIKTALFMKLFRKFSFSSDCNNEKWDAVEAVTLA